MSGRFLAEYLPAITACMNGSREWRDEMHKREREALIWEQERTLNELSNPFPRRRETPETRAALKQLLLKHKSERDALDARQQKERRETLQIQMSMLWDTLENFSTEKEMLGLCTPGQYLLDSLPAHSAVHEALWEKWSPLMRRVLTTQFPGAVKSEEEMRAIIEELYEFIDEARAALRR
jgi:hypothetical protein